MTESQISERLNFWVELLWGLILLTLPVTSFRYFPELFGKAQIQPLALYPLGLLFPLVSWRAWRNRDARFPRQTVPLIALILVTAAATFIGALYAPLELRGVVYWGRALRAWVTIAMGASFFISAYLVSKNERILNKSLKWLYAGLSITFVWGMVQAVAINTDLISFELVDKLQRSFSLRGLILNRISGFTFEPSFFADQLTLLALPWAVGGILVGYHVFKSRWLEWMVFAASGILLLWSFSRFGFISSLAAIILVGVVVGRGKLKASWLWLSNPSKQARVKGIALRVGLVLGIGGVVFLTFSWLSGYKYFANLWTAGLEEGFIKYAIDIFAGPRLADAFAGYEIFSRYPWTGVGLGGLGFYIFDAYPDWALTDLPEISRRLGPDSLVFPNAKNFYIRLLAETGLIGFWLFISFLLSFLATAVRQFLSGSHTQIYLGAVGIFIWVIAVLRHFTQDSFTFPMMWVVMGMIIGFANNFEDSTNQHLE